MIADPFAVLGLDPGADAAAVKQAYRRLVKECHPDRAGGDAAAARRFRDVTAAYEQIQREEGRAQARAAFWTGARIRVRAPRRGADRHFRLILTLEEAIAGGPRAIEPAKGEPAYARLPPGLADGDQLRVPGLGEPGRDGGPAGDALITIALAPHPVFRLDGRDAHVVLDAPPRALARGAEVDAPTPRGPIRLKIPANSRPGQVLRARGRGLPDRGGGPGGDLYVTLRAADGGDFVQEAAKLAERAQREGARRAS